MDIYRKTQKTNQPDNAGENTLMHLNDKLFAQLTRLTEGELSPEQLENEIKRTDAIVDLSKTIISNAQLCLQAKIAKDEKLGTYAELPKMINA